MIMDSRTGCGADEGVLLFRKKATTDRTARSTIAATPSILLRWVGIIENGGRISYARARL
jgi:hypothetical protein